MSGGIFLFTPQTLKGGKRATGITAFLQTIASLKMESHETVNLQPINR